MSIVRSITVLSTAAALASCGFNKDGENYDTTGGYDTSDPYGIPAPAGGQAAPYQDVNAPIGDPTYGPAAYDASSSITPASPAAAVQPAAPASIPATASTHTIVRGDTLWGLSRKYGVTADAIRAANGMAATDNNVRLGQTINIPAP